MRRKLALIVFMVIFLSGLASFSVAFHPATNRDPSRPGGLIEYDPVGARKPGTYTGGHDTITSEASDLKKNVHKSDADGGDGFKRWADDSVRWYRYGAHDEDSTKTFGEYLGSESPMGNTGDGNFYYHFYDSITGGGLLWFPSSIRRANDVLYDVQQIIGCKTESDLNNEEKEKLYTYLGKITHLIQDPANPEHTNNQPHIFSSKFEDYVRDNWHEILNSGNFKNLVNSDAYLEGNYEVGDINFPEKYIQAVADLSKPYFPFPENEAQFKDTTNMLVSEAIKYSAGYIDAVYKGLKGKGGASGFRGLKQMAGGVDGGSVCVIPPPNPPNPAGDHPDDRFDVSDEYYWEKEFKLSDSDLTKVYLRTAIKKGKIGVWYKYLFLETFFEGRTKYKDAPQEVKNALAAKFQDLYRKLDDKKNERISEWKGAPDVALFANGFYNPSTSLMLKIGEPVRFLDFEFNPDIVKDHPVMLVPTGGFYGMKNSDSIRAVLDEYVKRGGTLVVLTQQHGYDWAMLPTPTNETGERKSIVGYGYQEDQSCQFNSVYIDTYHPMLSGFSNSTANIGVDGYFTSYPENSTVLLRRVANGQPAMIVYPYGEGHVIATTLYTDFALAHHQANDEEIKLVQNIISWAKKPDTLVEKKPGETVDVEVSVSNFTDANASALKFIILDPTRKVISEEIRNISLSAGQSITTPFSFNINPGSALGIYHIDYALLDGQGAIIQPQAETDSGRFVISNPPRARAPDKPIWFSVSTSSQDVLFGAPFDYTFHIFNNTNETRNLKVRSTLRHTSRGREWAVVAEPNRETTISCSDLFIDSYYMYETMGSSLLDEKGQVIASYELSFKGHQASIDLFIQTDKRFYFRGETLEITNFLKNKTKSNIQVDLKFQIINSQNQIVFEDKIPISLSAMESSSSLHKIPLSTIQSGGNFIVREEIWDGNKILSQASAIFELARTQIWVNPSAPSNFKIGQNKLSFIVTNVGKVPVDSGVIEVILKDPTGNTVDSGSAPFFLGVGGNNTVEFSLNIPTLKFGDYALIYKQWNEAILRDSGRIVIRNGIAAEVSMDKVSYRIREIGEIKIHLTNTGKFAIKDLSLFLSLPEMGYSDDRIVSLSPAEIVNVSFNMPISEVLNAGPHRPSVDIALSSGDRMIRNALFNVPQSKLVVETTGEKNKYQAGELIPLGIENQGGKDTRYASSKLVIRDRNGITLFTGEVTGGILAGEKKTLPGIQIPSQAASRQVDLEAEIEDNQTREVVKFNKAIEINGLTANMQARTDKEAYQRLDPISEIMRISNGPFGFEKGYLSVSLNRVKGDAGKFSDFLPQLPLEGWGIFNSPSGIAAGTDGFIYVADSANNRIQKLDRAGNLVLKWGGKGTGEGQFDRPWSIALDQDGFVYVADGGRIQRFDNRGEFINAWECRGRNGGAVSAPIGIAVGSDGMIYVLTFLGEGWSEYTGIIFREVIQKYERDGKMIDEWQVYGLGMYHDSIAVGKDGMVYMTAWDGRYDGIQKFDPSGFLIWHKGRRGTGEGEFENPRGIAVDADGSIFVADGRNNRIQKFDREGNFLLSWGRPAFSEDGLFYPMGVTIAPDGLVYTTESYFSINRVQKFDKEGNFIQKWGGGGSRDGEFYTPSDIAVGLGDIL